MKKIKTYLIVYERLYERKHWQGQVTLKADNKLYALDEFYKIIPRNEIINIWVVN